MHRLSTICLLDHCNNGFMATDALGQTLHGFMQLEFKNSKITQCNNTAASIRDKKEEYGLNKHIECSNSNKPGQSYKMDYNITICPLNHHDNWLNGNWCSWVNSCLVVCCQYSRNRRFIKLPLVLKLPLFIILIVLVATLTVHHLPKCMSYHEAISGSVITRRLHCLSF